jgi:hypothetical protein
MAIGFKKQNKKCHFWKIRTSRCPEYRSGCVFRPKKLSIDEKVREIDNFENKSHNIRNYGLILNTANSRIFFYFFNK